MAVSRRPPPSLKPRPVAARGLCALACAGLALSACAPNLGPLPTPAPAQGYAASQSFDAPETAWPTTDWWTVYGDPQLDALEAEALKDAPDLRIAEARAREAQAEAERAGAGRFPRLSASASESEARVRQSIGLPPQITAFLPNGFHGMTEAAANLRYRLDLFGKTRATLAAATSEAEAARADRADTRLELTVAVADAYADFIRLTEDRDTAATGAAVRRETLKLVADRQRNGLETRGEYSQQDATVAAAEGEVEAIDLQILQSRHQIAALVGAGPDRGLALQPPAGAEILHPYGLPPHLALDLVGRRPDILAARLRAEAAQQRIKAAKADFYPNIDLSGAFDAVSFADQNIFSHSVSLVQFGPALSLPIFTGGDIEGAYRGARAQYDRAVADYDKTLAGALRDVADAIAAERSLQAQLVKGRASLAADEDAYAVAKLRYRGGLSPYLNVLTAETAVLRQRRAVVDLAARAISSDLNLVHALGGGFTSAPRSAAP